MGTLQVGRVGIDVTLSDPSGWNVDGDIHTVTGYLISSSLANTQDLRSELVYQLHKTIPVTWTTDATFDGYYVLRAVTVSSNPASLHNVGYFPFNLTLERLGSTAFTEFQSLLTTLVVANDHGLIGTEVHPFHGLPAAHYLYEGDAELGSVTRPSADGNMTVYRQIAFTAGTQGYDVNPNWGIAPGDFYDGAVTVKVGGRIRSGRDTPLNVSDWELSNGIIKVTPAASGVLNVATYNGSTAYHTAVGWKFQLGAGPTTITSWTSVNVVRNDPEQATIRMINDQAPSGSAHRNYVDLTLRRGAVFVTGFWYFTEQTTATAMKIVRTSTEAATAVTPTGALTAAGIRATADDGNGDRYLLGTPEDHTADTTNGGITHTPAVATDHTLPFFIGTEINGSTAQTGDTADSVFLQYFGYTSERVRAVRR